MGTEEVMGLPRVEWMTCEDLGRRGWDGETVLRTLAVVSRTVPHVTRRAGDVNPPVTAPARTAIAFEPSPAIPACKASSISPG